MDCRTACRDLSALADGELAPERIGPLETHLAACPECARFARLTEAVGAHFRDLPRPAAPAGLAEKVMGRLRAGSGRVLSTLPLVRGVAAAAAAVLVVTGAAIFLTRDRPPAQPLELTATAAVDRIMDEIVRDSAPALPTEEVNR